MGDVQLEPVGQNDTEDVQCEFNGNELSARGMLGGLGSPDRHDRIQNTSTDAIDKPCCKPLVRHSVLARFLLPCLLSLLTTNHPIMILRRALQARTHNSPNRSDSNGLDSPHAITQPTAEQSAEQRPQIIHRDNSAL